MKRALAPVFCISDEEGCQGNLVGPASFAVEELVAVTSDEGPTMRHTTIWSIHATRSAPLGRVMYGVTPEGWREDVQPAPLQLGVLYRAYSLRFSLHEDESGAIRWKSEG